MPAQSSMRSSRRHRPPPSRPSFAPAVHLGCLLLYACGLAAASSPARAQLDDVAVEVVLTAMADPAYLTHAGDDRLFVVQLSGRVVIVDDGVLRPEPFLDISDRLLDDRSLYSIALHPDYPGVPFVFAHYLARGKISIVARYEVDTAAPGGERADASSEAVLLRIAKNVPLHQGGQLQFGPDGYLYVATGDSTGDEIDPRCSSQSDHSLEGKILRLDVDRNTDAEPHYGTPADNPLAGPPGTPSTGTGLEEIWAKGLRNPWRFSFDRETGDLWIGDVGQDRQEEITRQPASSRGGENYGWPMMEGSLCFGSSLGCTEPIPACGSPTYTDPIFEYAHHWSHSRCSAIGGYVYRGRLVPALYGHYLYGDFCTGEIWAAVEDEGTWRVRNLPFVLPEMISFGEDAAGELYVLAGDTVFRIVQNGLGEAGLVELSSSVVGTGEGVGTAILEVHRVAGSEGAVSVDVEIVAGSATAGADFEATPVTLAWADGELGARAVSVAIVDDNVYEGEETLTVGLGSPVGGAALGAPTSTELRIFDDDSRTCTADATRLCLNHSRFGVEVDWRSGAAAGAGRAVPWSGDSGLFWFFDAENPELFVKVLDACPKFGHFWVFVSGLSDVEIELRVEDTSTGATRSWHSPLDETFEPIIDTRAFQCP